MPRFIEIVLSLLLLILTAPLFLTVYMLVWFRMGQPVFFRQVRPGLNGKPFTILKFRTMTNERGIDGNLKPDHERLTGLGRFLRKTSLDELPTLINVLKGDMSLVGPRPLLMEYLPLYNEEQRKRHLVKPGITGWAQINGRNQTRWEERFELDVWYVENQNLLLDLKILFLTILQVFRQDGISAEGHATMPKFKGND